ncbi:unnamed protein product [Peronospora belbahrii]|uniref:glucan endo-1,3-beta-D-glucosidase n=1 Tax=Peronospora belbahrii TaxID=622444 RepID=A0AAU9L0M3_9STRA|nr:unnamed protein product [Peronospora belbahrii]
MKFLPVVTTAIVVAIDVATASSDLVPYERLNASVFYSREHYNGIYTYQKLHDDFTLISKNFDSVFTSELMYDNVNAIKVAKDVGLRIAVAVTAGNGPDYIQLVCESVMKFQAIVDAVYVRYDALESTMNILKPSQQQLIDDVKAIHKCLGIVTPVGVSQQIESWNTNEGTILAKECDLIGVAINVFDVDNGKKPIENLKAKWSIAENKFGSGKLRLTMTGFPHRSYVVRKTPSSVTNMQQFLNDWADWIKGKGWSSYYLFFDPLEWQQGKTGQVFYGLCDSNGKPYVTFPSRNLLPK